MTLESLILNIPLLINLTIIGCYIIGAAATIFGLYDIYYLRWTGDLKDMMKALAACVGVLTVCTIFKGGSIVSNPMIAVYIYILVIGYFWGERNNQKLCHGEKPHKQLFTFK